ncbi:MAG: M50 family metallopeptidase [Bacillota bacterium]|nr:M50 family metallopeptidase [Bacillota bacterium]
MKIKIPRYLLILIAIIILWNTIIIKPLKIFTVYLHELGHALMAFMFGGGISSFNVNMNESGYTIVHTKGWFSEFMAANGGYLGSVLFAVLILYLKRTSFKKYILGTLAILFLGVSIKYSSNGSTLIYSIIFTAFVLLIYMLQNEKVTDWVIDIIGVASAAYAIYDTFVDTILLQINTKLHIINGWSKQPVTDAVNLARITHVPSLVWGAIWLAISIAAVYAVLKKSKTSSGRKRRMGKTANIR